MIMGSAQPGFQADPRATEQSLVRAPHISASSARIGSPDGLGLAHALSQDVAEGRLVRALQAFPLRTGLGVAPEVGFRERATVCGPEIEGGQPRSQLGRSERDVRVMREGVNRIREVARPLEAFAWLAS